jgi:hypothetical protein
MIKKILYWIIFVVIVVGAVYSYSEVGFGRKTAMLFQVSFGDANSMGVHGEGRPPTGQNLGSGQAPNFRPEGGPGQGPFGERGGRPPQGLEKGGGPGGGIISVNKVIPYAFILAFFTLMTCVIEKTIKRVFYSKLLLRQS